MLRVVMDLVADELDGVHERIGDRFARAEPRGPPARDLLGNAEKC